ncbi:hypothetical protein BJ944DRAFT_53929 [Cunninghamella echinulata]|nr:hypothetical protein BJ944DRAFT_53929 [Cunninghamella echinulata]
MSEKEKITYSEEEDTKKKQDDDITTTEVPEPEEYSEQEQTNSAFNTTDDEIILEDGLTASVPLSSLAGPALVDAPDINILETETIANTIIDDDPIAMKRDNFDWAGRDDAEEDDDFKKGKHRKSLFICLSCLSKNATYIAWTLIFIFALCLIAVDVALFMVHIDNDSGTVSYNLQLWFTFLAFMWCIGFLSQIFVELVPWLIKKFVGFLRPQHTEVLRMRLSYFMALRSYIKLVIITAWAWGSWAFISNQVHIPQGVSHPSYVNIFDKIFKCLFIAAIFLFVEKFFLQLIVTSFHKKAYGTRIVDNDKALKVLDKLKRVKRKAPQEFLLGKIKRKTKSATSRSQSLDEGTKKPSSKQPTSIMNNNNNNQEDTNSTTNNNVHFPSQNVDTLIAIPPLENQNEKVNNPADYQSEMTLKREDTNTTADATPLPKHRFGFGKKIKRANSRQNSQDSVDSNSVRPHLEHHRSTNSMEDYRSSIDQPTPNSGRRPHLISRDTTFLNSTSAIPGKLIKGGYRRIKHNTPMGGQQSTSQQAKSLAKRIYHNLMGPDPARDYMVESDLYPYFRTQEEAIAAFRLFDVDGNGDISKRELRSGCIRIYRERKNLARSMRDLSQATGKMDTTLLIIFTVIFIIIVCVIVIGSDISTQLMPLWSAFIAASFIFGTNAKEAFDSIIFVFVTHPYDAGDRVFIGQDNYIVDNVGLLVTTFRKWDGSIVYCKNAVLSAAYIINVRRAGPMGETVTINIGFRTPTWKIHQLREHMFDWCNQFPKMYTPNCVSVTVSAFENQNKINLSFYFCHTENWQDAGGRTIRHNNFMFELKDELIRLEVDYTFPIQPTLDTLESRSHPLDVVHANSSREGHNLHQRRPHLADDDDDYFRGLNGSSNGTNNGAGSSNDNAGDSGAAAGAAATMMFASTL